MNLQERVPLAPHTTLGVGGAARYFVEAQSVDEVWEALEFARANSVPIFVLGGGSNIVIADEGFDGLVLAVRIPGIAVEHRDTTVVLTVGAGVSWDEFVAWTVDRGFVGLECLSGIPGMVGGAVVANVGAYGAQCSDTFVSAQAIDLSDGERAARVFKKEACNFSYHDSSFSHANGRFVVVEASFVLPIEGTSRLSYRDNRFDLESLAQTLGHEPTLAEVRAAILQMRGAKGVLGASYRSAGSFFHMPFVSAEKYEEIAALARARDAKKEEKLRPWAWKQADGSYKIAPGFLLEYTEFQRGYTRGAIGISPRHTLSIINISDGRAADIAQLASDMRDAVEKIFGVRLEREVEYVGEVERGT